MNIFQKLVANWNTAVSAPYPRKKNRTTTRRNPPDVSIFESSLRTPGSATGPLRAPKPKRFFPTPGGGEGEGSNIPHGEAGECCADLESMMLICEDPEDPRHGAVITSVAETNVVNGVALVTIGYSDENGIGYNGRFPMCDSGPGPGGDPDPSGCCFDAETMKIVGCPDSSNLLLGATLVNIVHTDAETGMVTIVVQLPNSQTHTLTLPLCGLPDTDLEPSPDNCCYDQQLNLLVCGDNIPPNPLHMAPVVLEAINIVDGVSIATVYVNGDPSLGMRVPVCPQIDCCLDLSTGTLICTEENSMQFNELEVSVLEVGQLFARVSHSSLPGGSAYVPLCPSEDRGDCCYNQDTGQIECTDTSNPLHGMPAGIVTDPGPDANGIHFVEISSAAGQFRLLLCGEGECPPLYCCVNQDTGAFVCPGIPQLNGQPADVAQYVDDGGYRWAVLSNGQMVPVCGRYCPPPVVCPDGLWMTPTGECALPGDIPGACPVCPEPEPGVCPTCPPGMLLDTETGECVQPPSCPQCPPGFLLDTTTGQCVQCPGELPPRGELPPGDDGECPCSGSNDLFEAPCCDSCAHGGECDGEHDDAGGMESNPLGVQATACPYKWTVIKNRCWPLLFPPMPPKHKQVWVYLPIKGVVAPANQEPWQQVPMSNVTMDKLGLDNPPQYPAEGWQVVIANANGKWGWYVIPAKYSKWKPAPLPGPVPQFPGAPLPEGRGPYPRPAPRGNPGIDADAFDSPGGFLSDTCPIGWTIKNGRCVAPWWPEKPLPPNHVWLWVRKTNVPGWYQEPLSNEWIQPYLSSRPKCPPIGQGNTQTVLAVMPSKKFRWFCIHENDTYHAIPSGPGFQSGIIDPGVGDLCGPGWTWNQETLKCQPIGVAPRTPDRWGVASRMLRAR